METIENQFDAEFPRLKRLAEFNISALLSEVHYGKQDLWIPRGAVITFFPDELIKYLERRLRNFQVSSSSFQTFTTLPISEIFRLHGRYGPGLEEYYRKVCTEGNKICITRADVSIIEDAGTMCCFADMVVENTSCRPLANASRDLRLFHIFVFENDDYKHYDTITPPGFRRIFPLDFDRIYKY